MKEWQISDERRSGSRMFYPEKSPRITGEVVIDKDRFASYYATQPMGDPSGQMYLTVGLWERIVGDLGRSTSINFAVMPKAGGSTLVVSEPLPGLVREPTLSRQKALGSKQLPDVIRSARQVIHEDARIWAYIERIKSVSAGPAAPKSVPASPNPISPDNGSPVDIFAGLKAKVAEFQQSVPANPNPISPDNGGPVDFLAALEAKVAEFQRAE